MSKFEEKGFSIDEDIFSIPEENFEGLDEFPDDLEELLDVPIPDSIDDGLDIDENVDLGIFTDVSVEDELDEELSGDLEDQLDEDVDDELDKGVTPQLEETPLINVEKPSPKIEDYMNEPEEKELTGKYVDKENKKIIPLGSKGKIKSKDFDDRKNTMSLPRILSTVVFVLFVALFFVFGWVALNPRNNHTMDEIDSRIASVTQEIGFPIERGRAFAESFLYEYLTIDGRERNQILQTFGGVNLFGRNTPNGVTQRVIGSPITIQTSVVAPYSANFQIEAFVASTHEDEDESLDGEWVRFSVNVFSDSENDRLAIAGLPAKLPVVASMPSIEVPSHRGLGSGMIADSFTDNINPLVEGFLNEFAKATYDSHQAVLPFVVTDPHWSLISGWGGRYTVSSFSIGDIYYGLSPNTYDVQLNVTWQDTREGNSALTFTSSYNLGISRVSDSTYLIDLFWGYEFRQ